MRSNWQLALATHDNWLRFALLKVRYLRCRFRTFSTDSGAFAASGRTYRSSERSRDSGALIAALDVKV